jgi:hypothetical protein
MIFLSYTHSDTDIVDPVASAIGKHFGETNVFFDKWSISPGESIIGRMNEGLVKCTHFFLFMTEESMAKAFVSLEWHSALSQATSGGITRFVPIRASETKIPAILADLKYIDMYNNAIEATVKAIIQIVEEGIVTPVIRPEFKNLRANIIPKDAHSFEIEISAMRFVVPNAFFCIVYVAEQDVVVWIKGEPAIHTKSFTMILGKDMEPAIQVGTGRPLTPGIPVILQVSSKGRLELHAIMHQVGENQYVGIPLDQKPKADMLTKQ